MPNVDAHAQQTDTAPTNRLDKVTTQFRWTLASLKRFRFAFGLLVPLLFTLALVNLWPIFWGINLSLKDLYLLTPKATQYVWLDNYIDALRDPYFWAGLRLSAVYTVGTVFLQFVIGLMLALCLNEALGLRAVFRALVLLPWVVPSAMTALIWTWMYNGLVGVINDLLVKLHLTREFIVFLGDPRWVMPAVIIVTVWRGIPFVTVMLLAGLQSIESGLYEAAEVDGAGVFARFIHITIPDLRNIAIIAILTASLWTFNHVDTIFIMTAGGPANTSLTLALYNFRVAFQQYEFGYAASLSVMSLILLLLSTYIYTRVMDREDEDLI